MYPRIPSIAKALYTSPFVCLSCRYQTVVSPFKSRSKYESKYESAFNVCGRSLQQRHTPIPAPVTVVNAKQEIIPPFDLLYKELSALQLEAAVYVNPSQLQLALRALESENAVTRIAGRTASPTQNHCLISVNDSTQRGWPSRSSETCSSFPGGSLISRVRVGKTTNRTQGGRG